MSDQEKARKLLNKAWRVLSQPEIDLLHFVVTGKEGGEEFARICQELEKYLR
jgi:hypothetical protein